MTYFLLLPLYLICCFIIYLLIKKDGRDDQFFVEKKRVSKSNLLGILISLEEINKEDYSFAKKRVAIFFADNVLTENEKDRIEYHLLNSYFMGFKRRFIPFIKADPFLKLIFIVTMIYGFIYFNMVIYSIGASNKLSYDEILWSQLGASTFLFIIPVLFWFAQLGLLVVILSFLPFFNPGNGALYRAQATLDEMIKMLKPGGRNTPVKLGRPNMEDWARGI